MHNSSDFEQSGNTITCNMANLCLIHYSKMYFVDLHKKIVPTIFIKLDRYTKVI
jgi:hypothetical protein